MLQVGQSPVPGYKLEKFLGRGNFGEVWQSTSPGGTKSALKFLNLAQKQGRKEFRAIQRLKQIRHANLMPINAMWLLDQEGKVIPDEYLDTDVNLLPETLHQTMAVNLLPPNVQPSMLVIAMPQAELNLLELLRDYQLKHPGAGLPMAELLDYMRDAAKAIDYLNSPRHDVGDGVVAFQHSDVKPENLMLMGGSVLLCDFGVAKTLTENSDVRATSMGGSLAYISPESLNGMPSNYSDQFSLAVSYIELRTGELPFESHTMQQVINDRNKGVIDLSKLPPAEAKVVQRALSVKPDLRFPNTVQFVDAIREASIPPKKKSPLPAVVLLAAVAAGVAVIPFVINRGSDVVVVDHDNQEIKNEVEEPLAEGREERKLALDLIKNAGLGTPEFTEATSYYVASLQKGMGAEFPKAVVSDVSPLSGQDNLMLSSAFARSASGVFAWRSGDGTTISRSYELLPESADQIEKVPVNSQIYNLCWKDKDTLVVLAQSKDGSDDQKVVYFNRGDNVLHRIAGSYSEVACVGGRCYAVTGKKLVELDAGVAKDLENFSEDQVSFAQSLEIDAAVVYEQYSSKRLVPIYHGKILPVLREDDVDLAGLITRTDHGLRNQQQPQVHLVLTPSNDIDLFKGIYRLSSDQSGKMQWNNEEIDLKARPLNSPNPHAFSLMGLTNLQTKSMDIMVGHQDGSVSIWTRSEEGKWILVEEYDTRSQSYIAALGAIAVKDYQEYIVAATNSCEIYLIKRQSRDSETNGSNVMKLESFNTDQNSQSKSFDTPKIVYTDDKVLAVQFKDGVIAKWDLPHCIMVFEAAVAQGTIAQ